MRESEIYNINYFLAIYLTLKKESQSKVEKKKKKEWCEL